MHNNDMKFRVWNMMLMIGLMLASVVVAPALVQAQEGPHEVFLPVVLGEQSAEGPTSAGDQSSDAVSHSEDISINAASLSTLGAYRTIGLPVLGTDLEQAKSKVRHGKVLIHGVPLLFHGS